MWPLRIQTKSPQETEALGRAIGARLGPGDVVALSGDLGTGKTVLAHGIVDGAGASGYVASPTFTFIREYAGDIPVAHVDLYRIETARQLEDLGLDDVFNGRKIVIIEWAGKSGDWLPADHLWIALRLGDEEDNRQIEITAPGHRYARLIEEIASARHAPSGARGFASRGPRHD